MTTALGEENAQRILRVTDVAEESCRLLMPIGGYEDTPFASLENADGLTIDESASIMLYTLSWKPTDKCLYFALNTTLRSEDREKLVPWFPCLKRFLTALYRLPSIRRNVYRGVKLDLSVQYQTDKTVMCWGFSSCTVSVEVLKSEVFLGKTGARTIFTIGCDSGKDIQNHSYYSSEKEILLFAAI